MKEKYLVDKRGNLMLCTSVMGVVYCFDWEIIEHEDGGFRFKIDGRIPPTSYSKEFSRTEAMKDMVLSGQLTRLLEGVSIYKIDRKL